MKTFKDETVIQQVVDTMTCNRCGNDITMYDDKLEFDHYFGYNSTKFGDLTQVTFDLCEECIFEITTTFKIAPKVIDRL